MPQRRSPRRRAIVEGEYRADYAYHAQMEPLNAVAAVSPAGDAVEVWVGTQSQTITVVAVAAALGIPGEVKFNGLLLGGGFGRRGNRDVEFIVDSVLMSKAAGRPVKVMWTREDDVHNGRFRPLYVNRIRAGLDASGRSSAGTTAWFATKCSRSWTRCGTSSPGPRQHRDARH